MRARFAAVRWWAMVSILLVVGVVACAAWVHNLQLVVALGLAVASGMLFGVVPVRQVMRADPWQVIHTGESSGRVKKFTLRDLLLIGQWTDSRHSEVLPPAQYHEAAEGEDSDFK